MLIVLLNQTKYTAYYIYKLRRSDGNPVPRVIRMQSEVIAKDESQLQTEAVYTHLPVLAVSKIAGSLIKGCNIWRRYILRRR